MFNAALTEEYEFGPQQHQLWCVSMYVRWKVRKLSKRGARGPAPRAFYAVLAECKRIDGQPRQKVIKYLGHIHENDIPEAESCATFWNQALDKLEELDLPKETMAKIETKMGNVVPRPPRFRRRRGTAAPARGARKAVKKATKKATKKAAKKTARKPAKKAAKKAAKKTTRKAARSTAKRSAKKAPARSAKKATKSAKRGTARKATKSAAKRSTKKAAKKATSKKRAGARKRR
jgi:hypothetical protein